MYMESFYKLNFNDLANLLVAKGYNSALASNLFDHFYKFKASKSENLPPDFFSQLQSFIDFSLPKIVTTQKASDGTIKFLVELVDGIFATALTWVALS